MKAGSLEVICGCMFSGKTEELIRRVRRVQIAKQKVQVFRSHRDDRYSDLEIVSHGQYHMSAITVPNSRTEELRKLIDASTEVIAIDEAQFFDSDLAPFCDELANSGKRVIVAGLDLNAWGEPFTGPMQQLLAMADELDKLTAVCVECGEPAVRSQRIIGDQPAKYGSPEVLVGKADIYRAVCRRHHIVVRTD